MHWEDYRRVNKRLKKKKGTQKAHNILQNWTEVEKINW